MDLWEGTGCNPEQFAQLTDKFAESLGLKIRVLFVSRNLDTWLASRYAQSAPRFQTPGQYDFELKLKEIAEKPELYPVLMWINPELVKVAFEKYSSRISLGITTQEFISSSPLEGVKQLFQNSNIEVDVFDAMSKNNWKAENKRSTETGWVCRNSDCEIALTASANNYISIISNYLSMQQKAI